MAKNIVISVTIGLALGLLVVIFMHEPGKLAGILLFACLLAGLRHFSIKMGYGERDDEDL